MQPCELRSWLCHWHHGESALQTYRRYNESAALINIGGKSCSYLVQPIAIVSTLHESSCLNVD